MFRCLTLLCLCFVICAPLRAQAEGELTSKNRLYPSAGTGLRALKRGPDGTTCLLAGAPPSLTVYDAQGKLLFAVAGRSGGAPAVVPRNSTQSALVFAEDCDVDAKHQVYAADRGANRVLVFSAAGEVVRAVSVPEPVSIAVLPDDELAVATLREPHLVSVFGKTGHLVREFGDPEQISQRLELNRFLNVGRIVADTDGHVNYGFQYFPEPLVRQFDRHGYATQDISYTALDALPAAQAVRREIERQEKRGSAPLFKRVLTAIGVDRDSGEVWMALGNTLLRFDKEGNRRASYQVYTAQGARLEATAILVEKEKLVIACDPLGVYEVARPDLKEPN